MKIEDIDREFKEQSQTLKEALELLEKNEYKKAAEAYVKALRFTEQAFGDAHSDTLTCLLNLGDCYYNLKKYRDAGRLLERALYVLADTVGEGSPQYVDCLFKLAKAKEKQGRTAQSLDHYRHTIDVAEACYGPTHSYLANVLDSYSALLTKTGSHAKEAEEAAEQARQIREAAGGQRSGFDSQRLRSLREVGERRKLPDVPLEGQSQTGNLSLGQMISYSALALMVMALIGGGFAFGLNQLATNESLHSAIGDITGTKPKVIPKVPQPKVFIAPDGRKRLVLFPDGKAQMVNSASSLACTYTEAEHVLFVKSKGNPIVFAYRNEGDRLNDREGVYLYTEDAPEVKLMRQMESLTNAVRMYLKQTNRLPKTIDDLASGHPEVTYINPFTNQSQTPSLVGPKKQLGDLSLNDYAEMDTVRAQFLGPSSNFNGTPGAIELGHIVSPNGREAILIRAFDRDGKIIESSVHNRAFLLSVGGAKVNMQDIHPTFDDGSGVH